MRRIVTVVAIADMYIADEHLFLAIDEGEILRVGIDISALAVEKYFQVGLEIDTIEEDLVLGVEKETT